MMTLSWHTMIESEPPLVGCVISNRNYSFDILKATKECMIDIPTVELAEKAEGCLACPLAREPHPAVFSHPDFRT